MCHPIYSKARAKVFFLNIMVTFWHKYEKKILSLHPDIDQQ